MRDRMMVKVHKNERIIAKRPPGGKRGLTA